MSLEIKTKDELFNIIEELSTKVATLEERTATTTEESKNEDSSESTNEETQEEMTEEEIDELDKFLND